MELNQLLIFTSNEYLEQIPCKKSIMILNLPMKLISFAIVDRINSYNMKKHNFLFFLLVIPSFFFAQETDTVWVGGGGSSGIDPYYSPQFISINVGDTVRWINIQGTHNVDGSLDTYPGNPEGFYSGDPSQNWVFHHVFTIEGNYGFQCSQGDHAQTQFGIIMVSAPNSTEEFREELSVFPNPCSGPLQITASSGIRQLQLFDQAGRMQLQKNYADRSVLVDLDLSGFSSGWYLIQLQIGENVIRRKLILK